jgi:lipopolysaccharide export LptBFGC system permease protein LptF
MVAGFISAGFVLGQVWEMTLSGVASRLERRLEQKRKQECLEAHNKTLAALDLRAVAIQESDMPETSTMIEHLRAKAPSEAARLVKIRAEKRFCQVLFLGLLPLAAISLARAFGQASTEYFAGFAALLLIAWLSWQRALRFHAHMTRGACIAWLLHGFPSPFSPAGRSRRRG